jgi:hypothetical protein
MNRYFLAFILLFNLLPLFAIDEDDLFIKTIVSMISDCLEFEIDEDDLTINDIIENRNIWSSTVNYNENETFLILVDNINLYVILTNKKGPTVLFRGDASPPPWDYYPKDKRWIYSYFFGSARVPESAQVPGTDLRPGAGSVAVFPP